MPNEFKKNAYAIEMDGLDRLSSAEVAMRRAERELLMARTGKIEENVATVQVDVSDLSSDSVLTPPEKVVAWMSMRQYVADQLVADGGQNGLIYQAAQFTPAVSSTAYNSAINALKTYFNTGLGIAFNANEATVATWCSSNRTIVPATFRSNFELCAQERQKLLVAIEAKQKADAAAAQSTANTANTNAGTAQTTANTAQTTANTANTNANTALTLAGTKARVFYQASAPSSGMVTNDLWFSTDTTSPCVDANCYGHTVDSNGNPFVGSYPHRGLYTPHRYNGTAWVSTRDQALVVASEIAAGAIVANHIASNSIQTRHLMSNSVASSDYAFTGTLDTVSETAVRGARIRANASANGLPAILTSPEGIKIGTKTLSETWVAWQSIGIAGASRSGGVFSGVAPAIPGNLLANNAFIQGMYVSHPFTRTIASPNNVSIMITPAAPGGNASQVVPVVAYVTTSGFSVGLMSYSGAVNIENGWQVFITSAFVNPGNVDFAYYVEVKNLASPFA